MAGISSRTVLARHVVLLDVLFRVHCITRGETTARDHDSLVALSRARLRHVILSDARTRKFIEAEFVFPHKRQRCTASDTINRDNG